LRQKRWAWSDASALRFFRELVPAELALVLLAGLVVIVVRARKGSQGTSPGRFAALALLGLAAAAPVSLLALLSLGQTGWFAPMSAALAAWALPVRGGLALRALPRTAALVALALVTGGAAVRIQRVDHLVPPQWREAAAYLRGFSPRPGEPVVATTWAAR